MLGLLVIIVVSWLLLYFFEKKSILVLGIIPNKKHLTQFIIGLVLIMLINLSMIYIETLIKSVKWEARPVNYSIMFKAFVYHLKSALTEDLVFRGAILYILISRLGAKWAVFISALVFGAYHVFSYGILNERLIPILYVILVTGFSGYVWALCFSKTKSIALGLGLHLGYNLILAFFYQSQPYGEVLFVELSKVNLGEANESWYALFRGFYPSLITLIAVRILFKSYFNKKVETA